MSLSGEIAMFVKARKTGRPSTVRTTSGPEAHQRLQASAHDHRELEPLTDTSDAGRKRRADAAVLGPGPGHSR